MKKKFEGWRFLYLLAVLGGMLAIFVVLVIRNGLPTGSIEESLKKSPPAEDLRLSIANAVSKHVHLPSVLPEMERVDNPALSRLINPLFYQNAEINDYVLRYPETVILYRASTDQIVAMMPVAISPK